MQWWGRRGAIRAVLITGALTTLATSGTQHELTHDGEARTPGRGVVLTMLMTPELADNADGISLHVNWTVDAVVNNPALAIFPESDALQWEAFEPGRQQVSDGDGGFTVTGRHYWGARIYDLEQACPGAGACTLRFRIAAQAGQSTEGLAGTISVRSISTRWGEDELCSPSERPFPPGAEVTFSFEDIEEPAP